MSIQIATAVLARVKLHDQNRITVTPEVIRAWAECFEGKKVWPREAIAAVTAHYSKPNPFPIMPGDIIAFCEDLPPWSSSEHAQQFLETWAQFPYSDMIERYTGIQWPAVTPPDDMDLPTERAWLAEVRLKWVQEHRESLTGAILSRQYKALELEQ